MDESDLNFSLLTTFSISIQPYPTDLALKSSIDQSDSLVDLSSKDLFKLLPNLKLHLERLSNCQITLSILLPNCWCSNQQGKIKHSTIINQLRKRIISLKQSHVERATPSSDCSLNQSEIRLNASSSYRVRLTVNRDLEPTISIEPFRPHPLSFQSISSISGYLSSEALKRKHHYPALSLKDDGLLKVRIDDCPTNYSDNPFLIVKTTNRSFYDSTRKRHNASYEPGEGQPFDVLLFNSEGQVTETTISNVAFRRRTVRVDEDVEGSEDDESDINNCWITPHLKCGLLNGIKRQTLLSSNGLVEGFIQLDQLVSLLIFSFTQI
ncbi:aminotransferase class IV-domain-containing protein [Phakopsora pachyrhizi]|uniref:Aminotransferase class IV-domain-containing protein n=1 Tax=Phakopsora pachyrhizi TaxID=170000 RepID=A0AAV0APV2_PHAPC|nr:aminotransferase class IV-domain-containing protein [Phakopsora pachyrhizi]